MLTRWEKIKVAERMQRYIEKHLDKIITMKELAETAMYSQWHASRMFREVTGKSPFEYIRLRRLTAAAQELKNSTRKKVVDVALDFVFDSHEGFTRAFGKQFGISPSHFRKSGTPVELFLPPRLNEWYNRRQKGEISMSKSVHPYTVFVQVLEQPARRMLVRRGVKATHYFEYCEEVGCEVWDILSSFPHAQHEPMGMWLPERFRRAGTSEYVQGVEVPADFSGEIPKDYELMDLPACMMMVFQGPQYDDKDFEKAISSLWDVMSTYKPETYGFAWAEDEGPRFQLAPQGYRGYIEGRPVRRI